MKKKSPNDLLDEAIQQLVTKRDLELIQLKQELNGVLESIKPINLIKDTFKAVTASPDLKNGIGKSALGAASGLLVKNILFRNSYNPLKIAASLALQTVATGLASKNFDKIKLSGKKIFHALLSKFKHKKKDTLESEL